MSSLKKERLKTLQHLFSAFEAGLCGLDDPSNNPRTSLIYSQGTQFRTQLTGKLPTTRILHR